MTQFRQQHGHIRQWKFQQLSFVDLTWIIFFFFFSLFNLGTELVWILKWSSAIHSKTSSKPSLSCRSISETINPKVIVLARLSTNSSKRRRLGRLWKSRQKGNVNSPFTIIHCSLPAYLKNAQPRNDWLQVFSSQATISQSGQLI